MNTLWNWYNKESPLFESVDNDDLELVIDLLREGYNPNIRNEYGLPLLHNVLVSNEPNFEIIEALLFYGADPNINGIDNIPAIVIAKDIDTIEILLAYGANVNKKDRTGYSSLMEHALQGNLPIVELLIKNGAKLPKKFPKSLLKEYKNKILNNIDKVHIKMSKKYIHKKFDDRNQDSQYLGRHIYDFL